MEITWKYSSEDQTKIYIKILNQLKQGFYQDHRFYLLPFMPEKFRNRVVYLPKTSLLNKKDILKSLTKQTSFEDKRIISGEIGKISTQQKHRIKSLENQFNKTRHSFITNLINEVPQAENISVTISPALIGSLGDYSASNDNSITIYPRYDRNINNIYQLIITGLTHLILFNNQELDNNEDLWREKQLKAAELHRRMGLVHKTKDHGIVEILDTNYTAKLAQISFQYYQDLGFPIKKIKLHKVNLNLTDNEKQLLKLLEKYNNQVVTFDQIADSLWSYQASERFSQYAITKLVERLRKKISASGINIPLIHSQRGRGYLLYN